MNVGRNEPCPCGSGRKHKRCCLGKERAADPGIASPYRPSPEVRRGAALEDAWEADIVPLPWILEDDPGARPAPLLVAAGPFVIVSEVLRRPGGDPDDVAVALLGALEEAAGEVGRWPEAVAVRHPTVADDLAQLLAERAVDVTVDPELLVVDEVAGHLATGGEGDSRERLLFCYPETWSSWDLPEPLVRRIFEAAAELRRASPWEILAEDEGIQVFLPAGGRWYLAVLGMTAEPPGVVLYADEDDFRIGTDPSVQSPEEVAAWIVDRHYALLFSDRGRQSRAMQREVAARGWPVADGDAYPRLMAANTPAGGVSRLDAEHLVAALRAVAAFVREREAEVLEGRWGPWRDPVTGVELAFLGPERVRGEASGASSDGFTIPGFMDEMLDDGERAELQELFERPEPPKIDEVNAVFGKITFRHNRTPQDRLGGLSPGQVHALLSADWSDPGDALSLERALFLDEAGRARIFRSARTFLEALVEDDGTRATAAGNLNRAFVRGMMERLEWPETWLGTYLKEHRQVVNEEDVWHLHTLRVLLDLSGLIKKRKGRWSITRRGAELRADVAAGELYGHLFEVHFQKMNLAYLDRATPEGGFQRGIPFSLYRFRDVGREWRSPAELVKQLLLPIVREEISVRGAFDPAEVVVATRFLDPLEEFGLAEKQEIPGGRGPLIRYRYRKSPLYDRFLRFRVEGGER